MLKNLVKITKILLLFRQSSKTKQNYLNFSALKDDSSNKVIEVMNSLYISSSASWHQFTIFYFHLIHLLRTIVLCKLKCCFPDTTNKNHSCVKNLLTICYILFIPDLMFVKSNVIDFMIYIIQKLIIIS